MTRFNRRPHELDGDLPLEKPGSPGYRVLAFCAESEARLEFNVTVYAAVWQKKVECFHE